MQLLKNMSYKNSDFVVMSYRKIPYMVCMIMAPSTPWIRLLFTLEKCLPESCFLQLLLKFRLYFQILKKNL